MTRRSTSSITPSLFLALLGITLLLSGTGWAQTTTIRGGTSANTAQVTDGALHVTGEFTVEGAAGGTSQADNSAVTSITGIGALYDTTPPSITDGNVGLPVMDSSRRLIINCETGCGGSGGTSAADDADFTAGSTSGTPAMGVYESSVSSVTDGDLGMLGITARRQLKVAVFGKDGASTPGAGEMRMWSFADAASPPDGILTQSFLKMYNGASWDHVRGDTTNGLDVDVTRLPALPTGANVIGAVTQSGTWNIGSITTLPSVTIGTFPDNEPFNVAQMNGVAVSMGNGVSGTGVQRVTIASDSTGQIIANGGVAHDGADSGNPIKAGAKAETSLSTITTVADGDRTNLYAGIDGVLITRPHANLEDRVSGVASITDGSSTQVIAAQGAGIRFCATTLVVSNSSATNVTVDIRDGTAGSVLMTVPAAANMGGGVVPLQMPICTTANTIFAADPSAAASTVAVTAVGFKTKL